VTGPEERELEALALLDQWPGEVKGVVIGGYAVSAYARARYSVDLDLVIETSRRPAAESWLISQDFKVESRWTPREQDSAARVSRLKRGHVEVDLLAGAVRDREAAVDIPAEWVMRAPQARRLVLLAGSSRSPHDICRPEALFALKLQAGRAQDLSDLFMLQGVRVDTDEVRALFASLWRPSLARKLSKVERALGDEKVFRDACSRRRRGSPDLASNRLEWAEFRRRVAAAIPNDAD
jgi:hypothetical protein